MFKVKSILLIALLMLTLNPATAILDEHEPVFTGDLTGRWGDDLTLYDIKQNGNEIIAKAGIDGSSLMGTIDGNVISVTFERRQGDLDRGTTRKGEGELKINSDGTKLTGTKSGAGFRKGTEWILTKD
jgi:hypothetical protein